jgi:hypothetical protein
MDMLEYFAIVSVFALACGAVLVFMGSFQEQQRGR